MASGLKAKGKKGKWKGKGKGKGPSPPDAGIDGLERVLALRSGLLTCHVLLVCVSVPLSWSDVLADVCCLFVSVMGFDIDD